MNPSEHKLIQIYQISYLIESIRWHTDMNLYFFYYHESIKSHTDTNQIFYVLESIRHLTHMNPSNPLPYINPSTLISTHIHQISYPHKIPYPYEPIWSFSLESISFQNKSVLVSIHVNLYLYLHSKNQPNQSRTAMNHFRTCLWNPSPTESLHIKYILSSSNPLLSHLYPPLIPSFLSDLFIYKSIL